MFKKICSALAIVGLMVVVGCENATDSSAPDYTFSDSLTVGSISDPISGGKGDMAQIDDVKGNYILIVCDGVHLQRLGTNQIGYIDIPQEQFTIIRPGDEIQFAYGKDQIDYASRPPVVRAGTIRIMK